MAFWHKKEVAVQAAAAPIPRSALRRNSVSQTYTWQREIADYVRWGPGIVGNYLDTVQDKIMRAGVKFQVERADGDWEDLNDRRLQASCRGVYNAFSNPYQKAADLMARIARLEISVGETWLATVERLGSLDRYVAHPNEMKRWENSLTGGRATWQNPFTAVSHLVYYPGDRLIRLWVPEDDDPIRSTSELRRAIPHIRELVDLRRRSRSDSRSRLMNNDILSFGTGTEQYRNSFDELDPLNGMPQAIVDYIDLAQLEFQSNYWDQPPVSEAVPFPMNGEAPQRTEMGRKIDIALPASEKQTLLHLAHSLRCPVAWLLEGPGTGKFDNDASMTNALIDDCIDPIAQRAYADWNNVYFQPALARVFEALHIGENPERFRGVCNLDAVRPKPDRTQVMLDGWDRGLVSRQAAQDVLQMDLLDLPPDMTDWEFWQATQAKQPGAPVAPNSNPTVGVDKGGQNTDSGAEDNKPDPKEPASDEEAVAAAGQQPRVPAGSPKGGQFGSGGGAVDVPREPKQRGITLEVNKETAGAIEKALNSGDKARAGRIIADWASGTQDGYANGGIGEWWMSPEPEFRTQALYYADGGTLIKPPGDSPYAFDTYGKKRLGIIIHADVPRMDGPGVNTFHADKTATAKITSIEVRTKPDPFDSINTTWETLPVGEHLVPMYPPAVQAAGSVRNLEAYWVSGKGASKIGWGSGGDFKRCVSALSSYVDDPEGLCATYHRKATGMWPGKGRKHGVTAAGQPRVPAGSPGGGQWKATGASRTALQEYHFGSFNTNDSLRKGKTVDTAAIDEAMSKNTIEYHRPVHRVVDDPKVYQQVSKLKAGDLYQDPAYMSTTTNPDLLQDFHYSGPSERVRFFAVLTPRTHALDMKAQIGDSGTSTYYEQNEILVDRNTPFRVESVNRQPDGSLLVKMRSEPWEHPASVTAAPSPASDQALFDRLVAIDRELYLQSQSLAEANYEVALDGAVRDTVRALPARDPMRDQVREQDSTVQKATILLAAGLLTRQTVRDALSGYSRQLDRALETTATTARVPLAEAERRAAVDKATQFMEDTVVRRIEKGSPATSIPDRLSQDLLKSVSQPGGFAGYQAERYPFDVQFQWVHGLYRTPDVPMPEHVALAGRVQDEPIPEGEHFPGDHPYCSCGWVPIAGEMAVAAAPQARVPAGSSAGGQFANQGGAIKQVDASTAEIPADYKLWHSTGFGNEIRESGSLRAARMGESGPGAYTTDDGPTAENYLKAKASIYGERAEIMQFTAKRPLRLVDRRTVEGEAKFRELQVDPTTYKTLDGEEGIARYKAAGYDGVIYPGVGPTAREIVIHDPAGSLSID